MISALSQYHLSLFSLNNDISLAPQKAVPIFLWDVKYLCLHRIRPQPWDIDTILRLRKASSFKGSRSSRHAGRISAFKTGRDSWHKGHAHTWIHRQSHIDSIKIIGHSMNDPDSEVSITYSNLTEKTVTFYMGEEIGESECTANHTSHEEMDFSDYK